MHLIFKNGSYLSKNLLDNDPVQLLGSQMKTATLEQNGVSKEIVTLVSRLVDLIHGSDRRCACPVVWEG